MNIMLLMMGGTGSRFGESRPKQYTLIDDIPLFAYIVKKVDTLEMIDHLVIVSHQDWTEYVAEWCGKVVERVAWDVVPGGACRSESVLRGLEKAIEFAQPEDPILIHDATHPYVDSKGTEAVIEAVKQYGGATLASKNYDTVYQQGTDGFLKSVLVRENVVAGASPEAFRFGDIYGIYRTASQEELNAMTSAGAIALAHQIPMKVIPTECLNLKITYKRDMALYRELHHGYFFENEMIEGLKKLL